MEDERGRRTGTEAEGERERDRVREKLAREGAGT